MRFPPLNRPACRPDRPARRMLALVLLATSTATLAAAADRPRFLLASADDAARLRHALGATVAPASDPLDPFGKYAPQFQRLQDYFDDRVGQVVLPGEGLAAALTLWADPGAACADNCRRLLVQLADTAPLLHRDPLEVVLALDFAWDELTSEQREQLLLRWSSFVEPLTPQDSPLVVHRFQRRLAGLMLALLADDTAARNAGWIGMRNELRAAGKKYFAETFPAFLHARGRIPTSPTAAATEEALTALALEVERVLRQSDNWQTTAGVERWLEHYVLTTNLPNVGAHQFLRDDGTAAPPLPIQSFSEIQPLTAHLFAVRTHDPAAGLVARRVETLLARDDAPSGSFLWSWVPAAFPLRDVPHADPQRLPVPRNLDGAVILPTAEPPTAGVIWIDAGQPFLRRGQHFDAGNFLIRDAGYITVEAGEDIEFVATPDRGGKQRLADRDQPFDFAQFYAATIAHNCMLFWDPARKHTWYERPLVSQGGQQMLEGTLRDFSESPRNLNRLPGRLLAYQHHPSGAAYVRIDLADAYDRKTIAAYTREFILLPNRLLLVIDRARYREPRVVPTALLQLPTKPTVADAPLVANARQIAGEDAHAGVWRADAAESIEWRTQNATVRYLPLYPPNRRLAIVGGPAHTQTVVHPRFGPQQYVGGAPNSFERLVNPSGRGNFQNAWYRLGEPTTLGEHFAARPYWGRIELEPETSGALETLIVQALTWSPRPNDPPARVLLERNPATLRLDWQTPANAGVVQIPLDEPGGTIRFADPDTPNLELRARIQPDEPLPTRAPSN